MLLKTPVSLDGRRAHLTECLSLAQRMTSEHRHGTSLPARGWFVTAVIEYELGHADAAVAALQRCLRDYPEENYDSGASGIRAGPSAGMVYYVLGRAYQDQGREPKAIAAFGKAVLLLDSGRAQAQEAQRRLLALHGEPPAPAPWVRRVGGAGRPLEADGRERLSHWLRTEGYDLHLTSSRET